MRTPLRDPSGAAPPRTRGSFLLVTGGKGGVGKTTVAANLGLALAAEGARTLLADLDFGLANLNLILGLRTEHDVEDFLTGRRPLADCLAEGPGGLSVLPAGSGSVEMARHDPRRPRRLLAELRALAGAGGLVVGDSPAGIGGDVMAFATRAERVLVVTTPEPAAVTDAFGVIKALDTSSRAEGVELPTPDVFVNFAAQADEARSVADKLRTVCERFLARSPRFVGWMPRSRSVLVSVIDQNPFVLSQPQSSAARGIRRLARRYGPKAGPTAPIRP